MKVRAKCMSRVLLGHGHGFCHINILYDFQNINEVFEQLLLNLSALDSLQLLCNGASQSPSFPHVFSRSTMLTALRVSKGGNPGETRIGPAIKTFGGDKLGHVHGVLSFLSRTIDPTLLTGSSPVKLRFPNCNHS